MNIDYKKLKRVCLSSIDSFRSVGTVQDTRDGLYIYRENPKAKILGVAHLDSVLDLNHFHVIQDKRDTYVINAQLDDRLGVYVLLDILPKMGIEFDLLLTEGEEVGRSTAAYFETDKQYNWMFSFDRRLDDVVMYQYQDKTLQSDLYKSGFRIGLGSFSDIVFLDHLGIRGFNVGVGYDGEHSALCSASMGMMTSQIKKFAKFYRAHKNTPYPYSRSVKQYPRYAQWDDICYLCNETSPNGHDIDDIWICDKCMPMAMDCEECGDIVLDTEIINGVCSYCRDIKAMPH